MKKKKITKTEQKRLAKKKYLHNGNYVSAVPDWQSEDFRKKPKYKYILQVHTGSPPAFASPETMKEAINEYFVYSHQKNHSLSIAGLAMCLGVDRDTVLQYNKKDEFAGIINYAKAIINYDMERRLSDGEGSSAGLIFLLKNNYKYKDKHDLNHSGNISISKLLENTTSFDADDADIIEAEIVGNQKPDEKSGQDREELVRRSPLIAGIDKSEHSSQGVGYTPPEKNKAF